jgi:hypothetical protein
MALSVNWFSDQILFAYIVLYSMAYVWTHICLFNYVNVSELSVVNFCRSLLLIVTCRLSVSVVIVGCWVCYVG